MRVVYVFPGAGMYGFHQLGYARRLQKDIETKDALFVGASAGAITSAILVCDLDMTKCVDIAIRIMQQHGVFTRYLGLLGIWSRIVKSFLEEILPPNAHILCTHRVHVFLQRFPCTDDYVSVFSSRQHLIETLVTSSYVPFFAGPCPFKCHSSMVSYDGAINLTWAETRIFGDEDVHYRYIDYHEDPTITGKGPFLAHTPEWIQEMYEAGFRYAVLYHSFLS